MDEKFKSKEYVLKHKKIKEKFEETIKELSCGCLTIRAFAVDLKMDERTVRSHLDIMEMYKEGLYIDPERKIFCSKNGIRRITKKVGLEVVQQ